MSERRLNLSCVRGCPGWHYSLRVRHGHYVTFSVHCGPVRIGSLTASPYRTTTLARKMGERILKGYEHVARDAIHAHSAGEAKADGR